MKLYLVQERRIRMDPKFRCAERSFKLRADILDLQHPDNDEQDRKRWYLLREALKQKLGDVLPYVTVEFEFDGDHVPKLNVAVEGSLLKSLHDLIYLGSSKEHLKLIVTAKGMYKLKQEERQPLEDTISDDDSDWDEDDYDDNVYPVIIKATDLKLPDASSYRRLHMRYQQKNVFLPEAEGPGDLWRKHNLGRWKLSVEILVEKFAFHAETLSHSLLTNRTLLQDNKFCDLTIVAVDGTEFPCHKAFLCAHSEVFTTMLDGARFKEGRESKIEIRDMSPSGVRALLEYLYCGDVREALVRCSVALELFRAADKYDIGGLRRLMAVVFTEKQNGWFDTDVALELFQIAQDDTQLKEKCISVLAPKYRELEESESFRDVFKTKSSQDMMLLTLKMVGSGTPCSSPTPSTSKK